MIFYARVKPGSRLERLWRDRQQASGMAFGVRFTWYPTCHFYESDELRDEQVSRVKKYAMAIDLITVTQPVPVTPPEVI